jgi:hypothetical protein
MPRRFALILLPLVALLVAAATALVLTQKPDLDAGRDRVDRRWTELRSTLAPRYDQLAGVAEALQRAGTGSRSVSQDLGDALARWQSYVRQPGDAGDEAELADALEGLAVRVRANVAALPRLRDHEAVNEALALFATATVDPTLVRAYNTAVRAYEDRRDDLAARLPAALLGYDARPLFLIPRVP